MTEPGAPPPEIIGQLAALALLMALSCFGPGFLVVRRFRWDPVETFTASVGLSLLILYLLAFSAFWAELPAWANLTTTAGCAVATAVTFKDARRLFGSARLRGCVRSFGWLMLWTISAQLLIRHYSGGESCCDWVEHYQRSMNFVQPKPDNFQYIGRYLLTARPPFMNVVCAHFLAQVGTDFALYQVVFTVLNLTVFLPCVLVARLIARRGLRSCGLLAVMLAANPMFFENTTFAWTKALTATYVLLGLWFYLAGLRRRDPLRLGAAFTSLATGCLVHFSAAPYALFLGLHYLFAVWRLPRPVRTLGATVAPAALVLATWFTWAVGRYGVRDSFLSNSTVADTSTLGFADNLAKGAGNIWDSIRPHLFSGQPDDGPFRLLIDRAFMLYQVNLPLAVGSVGCLVAGWLLVRGLGSGERLRGDERLFWRLFIPFEVIMGIAAHGERVHSGLAHIGLQPLVYSAVALIVAEIPRLPARVRLALAAGVLVDFFLGVVLELYMEHSMDPWAWSPNWDWKANEGLIYLGDRALVFALPVALAMFAGASFAFVVLVRWLAAGQRTSSPARIDLAESGSTASAS